ncbi:MAG: MotA/TolQ/ExbB proton channel family protein [Pseudomonadales bacterium]|nr:MotA/TolQ/ExbB proton channel family protein [Pseudomonadales bacterium]
MIESFGYLIEATRSSLLETGALQNFLYTGGPVLVVIFLTTLVLWFLIAERFWFFMIQSKPYSLQVLTHWNSFPDHDSWTAQVTREKLLSEARIKFNSTLAIIRTLIGIAPLLGLLGTVNGMIEVFDVIAFSGSSNARAMASGISKCILSTMAGLVVAISGVYFINLLQRYSERSVRQLSKQMQLGPNDRSEPDLEVQYAS